MLFCSWEAKLSQVYLCGIRNKIYMNLFCSRGGRKRGWDCGDDQGEIAF